MNYYDKLGIKKLINAVDTYTIIGGSTMPDEVINAMVDASKHFVNLDQLQEKAGEHIASLTKNEGAYITSGAAAGLAISTAACITGTNPAKAEQLPNTSNLKSEVIIHRCQRNGYDHAIRQVGVKLVEIGNVDITYTWQLENAINDRTACIVYFMASVFSKGALPLSEVIRIGKNYGIPVIVDAAAQLPPVENLWKYTHMGADLVVFSGGKTLRGPQSSGVVLGKKELVEACKINGNPNHSLGRSMKVGKEEMVGLLAAIERYINLDHQKITNQLEGMVSTFQKKLNFPGVTVVRLFPGPVGQTYPRALVRFSQESKYSAIDVKVKLENGDPCIIVGLTEDKSGVIINPLNLQNNEMDIIINRITKIVLNDDE